MSLRKKVNKLLLNEETYKQAVLDCHSQMAAIATFDGLTIERKGVWVWVTGNTRKHHLAIKGAGFKYAPKKQAWYWHPDYVPTQKSKPASMEYIRSKWMHDTDVYKTSEAES